MNVRREEDAQQVRQMNIPHLEPIVFDLEDDAAIVQAEKTIREWSKKTKKPFTALINNAVRMESGLFEVMTTAQTDAFVAINFRALMIVTKTFIPLLRESKGRIINVSSLFANTLPPGMNYYSGAKAFMDAMTTGLRIELAPVGIASINIKPAFMASELIADMNKYLDQVLLTLFPLEYRAMYKVDIPKLKKDFLAFTENAGPLSAFDDAVADALKNPKPQTLYSMGTLHGIPDPAIVLFLSNHLPESVFQLMLSVMWKPRS